MALKNITDLIPLVLECGKIALNWQDKLIKTFKSDRSIVTQADQEIEALIIRTLGTQAPDCLVLGEETSGDQISNFFPRVFDNSCFVVDPIDGTAPYSNGLPTWGVSLGLMEKGILTQGIIYLAALGEIYFTQGDKSWMARVTSPESNPVLGPKKELPQAPETFDTGCMIALSQRTARLGNYKLEYPFQMTGSTVFALAKIAQGCYGAYVAQICLWDFAAGWPILKNLGYVLETGKSLGKDQGTLKGAKSMENLLKGPQNSSPWNTKDTLIFAPGPMVQTLRHGIDEEL